MLRSLIPARHVWGFVHMKVEVQELCSMLSVQRRKPNRTPPTVCSPQIDV